MYDMTFRTLIKLQKRQHSSNLTTYPMVYSPM